MTKCDTYGGTRDKILHYNLRLRLQACIQDQRMQYHGIRVRGVETWKLNTTTTGKLNGTSTQIMISIVSGKTIHHEVSPKWRSFNLVKWIRVGRLTWLDTYFTYEFLGPERQLNQTIFEMFKLRTEGDLLMDVTLHKSWRYLCSQTCDCDGWRTPVNNTATTHCHRVHRDASRGGSNRTIQSQHVSVKSQWCRNFLS